MVFMCPPTMARAQLEASEKRGEGERGRVRRGEAKFK